MAIRPATLKIDLDAAAENVRAVRRLVGSERSIVAVVKADGYGFGAAEVGRSSRPAAPTGWPWPTSPRASASGGAGSRCPCRSPRTRCPRPPPAPPPSASSPRPGGGDRRQGAVAIPVGDGRADRAHGRPPSGLTALTARGCGLAPAVVGCRP
ncbi:MAG: alanine racemase [Candidatus Rokubacteria bacterium]|nr:alanine racemase [Candidatus Rokubacteria bacterium]